MNNKPMGNERPEQHGFPGRPHPPFAPTPRTMTPFTSPRPEGSGYGAAPQPRFNGPIPSPQSSYAPTNVAFNPRYQTPQFPSPAQPVPTMAPSPFAPSGSQQPMPPSASYRPQPHIPSVPMRFPPQNMNPNVGTTPLSASSPMQPGMQGYTYRQPDPITTQVPPPQAPPFFGHQGGYGSPPPRAIPGMTSRDHMQHPVGGPPMRALQGLVEEFSSLSVGSVPGSIDLGVDAKTLPRPLDGDLKPKAFSEMYPLNCDSRYLRLTTSAMPNSQSLLSRWHLPLGAVVHPLAEAPDGEEVPIVNFGPTGIIRCRRCRTYVNPYVTFTDAGRKWRCNICSLLNDVPGEYFAYLDASGRRTDADQRPELMKGSVEFVAPTEYMVRPPMPPLYFFLIDVSGPFLFPRTHPRSFLADRKRGEILSGKAIPTVHPLNLPPRDHKWIQSQIKIR